MEPKGISHFIKQFVHEEQVDGCKAKALGFLMTSALPAHLWGPATSEGSCLVFRVCQRAQLFQEKCCSQNTSDLGCPVCDAFIQAGSLAVCFPLPLPSPVYQSVLQE